MRRKFRLLRADEIECRVQTCNEKGASLLLYKDARCDMNILDETVGAENWQRDHKELKGVIYAGVALRSSGEWIWKWDAGAESNTEKEKGEASDSFKRACVNWGVGRELYTSPFIWIKGVTELNDKGKWICKDKFVVHRIEYVGDSISYLEIWNKKKEIVFQHGSAFEGMSPRTKVIVYCKNNDMDFADVAEKYELDSNTTPERFDEVLEELKENGQ